MPDDAPLSSPRLGVPSPPSYRPGRAAPALDRGTRTLVIAAAVVVGLLLLLVAFWGLSGRHGGAVPVIQADQQPWRVKPDNPGGMQVAGANDREGGAGGRDATAPAPEAPAPEALRAAQPPAEHPAPPSAAAPAPSSPSAPAPAQGATARAGSPAAAPTRPAAPAGGTLVQLAALDTEALAHTEWQRLRGRMADLLSDHQPVFQRIERDGHTLWRLRVGGFPSIADATRFCERVRTKGGACELATF